MADGGGPLGSSPASSSAAPAAGRDAFEDLIAPLAADDFFRDVWQQRPMVISPRRDGQQCSERRRPLHEQTWSDCCDLLGFAWGAVPFAPPEGCDLLVFEGRQITHAFDDGGPWIALLNGASCVVNHAEYVWPPIAHLCSALRARLAHVYCNCYVTPPGCQAAPPHADDRDVFVLQVRGRKHWRVWGAPPVPFPYPDEQVGKNGTPVPLQLLDERPAIECVLEPGDVLYMPRGFVHEAYCPSDASSWHATLAVATHDWSWSKVVASAIAEALDDEASARWRRAVPLGLAPGGRGGAGLAAEEEQIEAALGQALEHIRKSIHLPTLQRRFEYKLAPHNRIQADSAGEFASRLARFLSETGDAAEEAWPYWRPCTVGPATRLRGADPAETDDHLDRLMRAAARCGMMGKGKGKGKGKGSALRGIVVRDEAAAVAQEALRLVREGPPEGMTIAEMLRGAAAAGGGEASFDELSAVCLVKASVLAGALSAAQGRRGPRDFEWPAEPPRIVDAL